MYCSKCGKELPNEAEFCGYCGNAVAKENQSPKIITQAPIEKPIPEPIKKHFAEPTIEPKKQKKKNLTAIVSIVVMLSLVIGGVCWFFLDGNRVNTCEDSIAGNMNSIKWHLETQYDITDISKVRFYDGLRDEEQSFVFVQLPSETRKVEDGKFLIFIYRTDLSEGTKYIGSQIYETQRLELTLNDDRTFWEVIVENDGGNSDRMYVTFDKHGRVERILISNMVFDYKYDEDNRVSELTYSEANGDSYNSQELYGSVFIKDDITERCNFTYNYQQDGKLDSVDASRDLDTFSEEEIAEYQEVAGEQNCSIDGDTFTWCYRYFAYVSGQRAATSNYFTTISFEYGDDGYITQEKTSYYYNRENPYYIYYEYDNDGISYDGSSGVQKYTSYDDLVSALIEALVRGNTDDALKLFDAASMDALYAYMNANDNSAYDWRTECSQWLDESLKPYLLEGNYTYEVTDYDSIGGTEETNSARDEAGMVFNRAYQLVFDHYYLAILEQDGCYYLAEDFIHLW